MFVALCLMALLLVIAFSVNTGIAVNDRVRMQEAADLATYAAAYSEAAALNDITKKNQAITQAVKECRSIMEQGGVPWATPCFCGPTDDRAELALRLCRANIDIAVYQFVVAANYGNSVAPALKAGKRTAEANFTGTGKNTTFFENTFGSPTRMGTYQTEWSTTYMGGVVPSIADFEQVTDTALNYQILPMCNQCGPSGAPYLSPTTYVDSWFYKSSRDPDVWVAGRVSGTPEKRFLDTDYRSSGSDRGYFGGSSTGGDDLLVAYAVAKPYDGSVGPTDTSPLQRNGNGVHPTGVYDSDYVRFPKLAMYDEYRARMAGIQDGLSGSTTPTTLIALDGAELGKSWDTSKFEH